MAASLRQGCPHRAGWRVPDQLAGCFDLRGAIGQPETHGLVVEDGLAKASRALCVLQRAFERRARHAHALGGDADAPPSSALNAIL